MTTPIPYSGNAEGEGNTIIAVGNAVYMLNGNFGNVFQKYTYDSPVNTWTTLTVAPGGIGAGAAMAYPGSGTSIYVLRGNNTNSFWKYDTVGNNWTTLGTTPANVNAGGAMAIVGNTLYAFGGGSNSNFWSYDTTQAPPGTWVNLTATNGPPEFIQGGGSLVSGGTDLYAFAGNNLKLFGKYNTTTGSWSGLAQAPDTVANGGSLTTDGTDIYATRGEGTYELWKYTVTSNTWSVLKDTPATVGSTLMTQSRGGITYMATGPSGGPELYLTSGNGSTSAGSLFRYKIAANTWPQFPLVAQTPTTMNYGSSIAYPPTGGDIVYFLHGVGTSAYWKYLLSLNTWVPWNRGKVNGTDMIAQNTTSTFGTSITQSTGASIGEAGGKIYVIPASGYMFLVYDPDQNTWRNLPLPSGGTTGASLIKIDNNTLYMKPGGNTTNFWKYSISDQAWFTFNAGKNNQGKPFSQLSVDDGYGGGSTILDQTIGNSITEYNGRFYILAGAGSNFLRFDPTANRWFQLANFPVTAGSGTALITIGSSIYALGGNNTTSFYRYDIAGNSWSAALAVTPGAVHAGGSLAYTGGNYIYAFRGRNNSTGLPTNEFYKYCIATTAYCTANTWANLTSTSPAPAAIQAGGSMVALNGTEIYAMGGNGTPNFWKFTVTDTNNGTGTWTDLTGTDPVPATVFSGGSLTTDGTYIYATRGSNTPTFWRYDPGAPAGNRWTTLNSLPVNMGNTASWNTTQGGIAYSSGLGDIFAVPGNGYGNYNQNIGGTGLIYRYQLNPGPDQYTWPYFAPTAPLPSGDGNLATAMTYPGTGDLIYAFHGSATDDFWVYDMTTNVWRSIFRSKFDDNTALSQTSTGGNQGAGNTIAEANNKFYTLVGGNASKFQVFDPVTNTWTALTDTPATIGAGAFIVKRDNNTLYIYRGNGGSEFWKYIIDADPVTSGDQGAWATFNIAVKDDGAIMSQEGRTQGNGNSIVKYTNPLNNQAEFYIFPGNSTTSFEKYNPTTNTWTTLAPMTTNVFYGGSLVQVSGATNGPEIYGFSGGGG